LDSGELELVDLVGEELVDFLDGDVDATIVWRSVNSCCLCVKMESETTDLQVWFA